jgi:hypothetical protein
VAKGGIELTCIKSPFRTVSQTWEALITARTAAMAVSPREEMETAIVTTYQLDDNAVGERSG